MSTTWGSLEVGSRVIHQGSEHVVRVLKHGGLSVRAVLEPVADGLVAKVSVRAKLSERVELVEGSAEPDRAGSAITNILGGTEVARRDGDDIFTCAEADVTTVASHLRILHGVELQGLTYESEADLLRIHDELHAAPFHEPPYPHRHEGAA